MLCRCMENLLVWYGRCGTIRLCDCLKKERGIVRSVGCEGSFDVSSTERGDFDVSGFCAHFEKQEPGIEMAAMERYRDISYTLLE